jgi:hypothetical protein
MPRIHSRANPSISPQAGALSRQLYGPPAQLPAGQATLPLECQPSWMQQIPGRRREPASRPRIRRDLADFRRPGEGRTSQADCCDECSFGRGVITMCSARTVLRAIAADELMRLDPSAREHQFPMSPPYPAGGESARSCKVAMSYKYSVRCAHLASSADR